MTGTAATLMQRRIAPFFLAGGNDRTRARSRTRPRAGHGKWMLLLLALPMLLLSVRARADCSSTSSPGTVTFSPPATITLPNNLPVGTILWTTPPASPGNPPTLNCTGNTDSGVVNSIGSQPSNDNTLFPTNVPGLSYRLLHPDTSHILQAYPHESIPASSTTFSVASALQLVVTGPITAGSTLSGKLGQWNVDMQTCFLFFCQTSTKPVADFFTSTVKFVAPACTVAVDPTVVTLPAVTTSVFSGTGSTAGQTAFDVQLNCQGGTSVAITLATASQQSGSTSVIAPGTGNAKNVGVQILGGNSEPITFGSVVVADTTTTTRGINNLPFYARYYQTGSPVMAGRVAATATYTLTYP